MEELESELPQQAYRTKPIRLEDVRGLSSKSIFLFMKYPSFSNISYLHPIDVDDWERNRALLLCYPEWRSRIKEMSKCSEHWKILVENWETIEQKYFKDYEKYGDNIYEVGECDKFIRSLIDSIEKKQN